MSLSLVGTLHELETVKAELEEAIGRAQNDHQFQWLCDAWSAVTQALYSLEQAKEFSYHPRGVER